MDESKRTAYKRAFNEKTYARLAITVPKAQKEAIEAHAKSKDKTVNGLVNALLQADMGLSADEWKRVPNGDNET